jgi:hypothetical protein
LRRFVLLVAAVALLGGVLAACVGAPPPPPPTDPHDVLVVGDSVSFSFGCALGDSIPSSPSGCPARPGYTTKNQASGACTITPGDVLLYNGGGAPAPNCYTAPGEQGRTWEEAADYFVPKVVVVNTAGWEVVDRWIEQSRGSSTPDAQWGGSTGAGTPYERAAVYYSSTLYNVINMFRSKGAKVLIPLSPYFDPPEPTPPPSQVGAAFGCTWWEPYDATPPTAGGECAGAWTPPYPGVTYRSSRDKVIQFDNVITQVKNQYFATDANVVLFNFKKHFNGPNDVYTSYICAPPDDSTVAAQNVLDFHTTDPLDTAYQCDNGSLNSPLNPWPYAILARAPDNGHLSVSGMFDILQPYLESCVKSLLGIGGSQSDCS